MTSRVSVSAISTYRLSLAEDLAFWSAHGIDHVGVSVAKLEAAGIEEGARRLRDSGVRVTNLIGIGPFRLDQPEQWDTQRDRIRKALDAAEALSADCMILTTGPAGQLPWEDAADALEAALQPVIEDANGRGIPFGLEHTNSLRPDVGFIHSLRDCVDVARRMGIGVCVETNACWAERGLADTIRSGVETFRIVQVSDYAIGTHCTPDRRVPGDGDIPFDRILGQMLAAGYEGAFDLELIGPKIDEEGYESACTRSVANLGTMLEKLGA